MIRAEAVADVRFGLRAAFSTASLPGDALEPRRGPAPMARMLGPGEHRPDDDGADDDEQGAEADRGDGVGVAVAGPGRRSR